MTERRVSDQDLVVLDSYLAAFPIAVVLFGLYLTSKVSFLLFHSLAEGFSIAAGVGVFMIAWHSRRFLDNGYLSFLGIAYLFVAGLSMLHTLSYEGTGIFPGYGPDLPVQLWVAARLLQGLSLLLAPLFLRRRFRYNAVIIGYALVTAAATAAIFCCGYFPRFLRDGIATHLLPWTEYVLAGLFLLGGAALLRVGREFDPLVRRWLLLSIAFATAAELFFARSAWTRGGADLLGHFCQIISFYLVYKAVIETGLVKPYNLLFRNLKRSEEELREDNDKLLVLQRKLAEQNEELQRLNEQKNAFIGMAAHDLRSPLAAIQVYSDFILEGGARGFDQQQENYLLRIRKSSEFMLSLVDDLLDIATIESGKLTLDPKPTDLAALVEQNVQLNLGPAGLKRINVVFDRQGAGRLVPVDQLRMEQALNNLISNAIKFSHPDSTVRVGLRFERDEVVISVQDEGQGIPQGEHGKLFDAFTVTSVRGTAGEKSTGLGLAIVKKIVEGHGGRIRVESEVGRGTTFFISLPLPLPRELTA